MSETARVYEIEILIRNRGHVSFQTLLDELEVSPATLTRDLDYLKDQLGAPIVYHRFLSVSYPPFFVFQEPTVSIETEHDACPNH